MVFIQCINTNVSNSATFTLAAKGGIIDNDFYGRPEVIYKDVQLTVIAENATGVARIKGKIYHPYTPGDFVINAASPTLVKSSEIQVEGYFVRFDLSLTDDISDERIILFTVKPTLAGRTSMLQGGFFYTEWNELSAVDGMGHPISTILYGDVILRISDFGEQTFVQTHGFPAEVVALSIVEINRKTIAPIALKGQIDGSFLLETFATVGLGGEMYYYPLTFRVVMIDGSQQDIYVASPSSNMTLSPPSETKNWELFR